MLLLDTYVDRSAVHGLGLFAAHAIEPGTVIWRFDPRFDQTLSREELAHLPEAAAMRVLSLCYFSEALGKYVLCADGARFTNHHGDPNTRWEPAGSPEGQTVASRHIKAGEEILVDYTVIDDGFLRDAFAEART